MTTRICFVRKETLYIMYQLYKMMVEALTSHGLFYRCPFWALTVVVPLLSVKGLRALRFNRNIFICAPKMNRGLMCLERYEGELLMSEF